MLTGIASNARKGRCGTPKALGKGTATVRLRAVKPGPLTKAYRIHAKADRGLYGVQKMKTSKKQAVEAEWLELLDAMASDDAAEAIEHEFGDHMFTPVESFLRSLAAAVRSRCAPALNAATERFPSPVSMHGAIARERNLD